MTSELDAALGRVDVSSTEDRSWMRTERAMADLRREMSALHDTFTGAARSALDPEGTRRLALEVDALRQEVALLRAQVAPLGGLAPAELAVRPDVFEPTGRVVSGRCFVLCDPTELRTLPTSAPAPAVERPPTPVPSDGEEET